MQWLLWFERKNWERTETIMNWEEHLEENKLNYGLGGIILYFKLRETGERIQWVLWFERKRWERTESIMHWEEQVWKYKEYGDFREKGERVTKSIMD